MTRPIQKTAMVVASNRLESMKQWTEAWGRPDASGAIRYPWDITILVEGNPTKTFDVNLGSQAGHFSYAEIDKRLGPYKFENSISRGDSAIKCFGFMVAATQFEADLIMALDDDCYPVDEIARETFVNDHYMAMSNESRWVSSVPDMKVRGVPHRNIGKMEHIKINMGLWTGVPDLDAVNQLVLGDHGDWMPPESCRKTKLMHPHQYVPFCGMNIAFRREATPLMYFPKMGEGVPYGRFDDIWAGVISQKICRHLGWSIAYGPPWIKHMRASNPFRNLIKESHGIEANEEFWEAIDAVALPESACTPVDCLRVMAKVLPTIGDFENYKSAGLPEYLNNLEGWLNHWCRLFEGKE